VKNKKGEHEKVEGRTQKSGRRNMKNGKEKRENVEKGN
jgi:hypothetical protein